MLLGPRPYWFHILSHESRPFFGFFDVRRTLLVCLMFPAAFPSALYSDMWSYYHTKMSEMFLTLGIS